MCLSCQTCVCRDKTHLLSRQKCACRIKSFVTTKIMFVMTKYICSSSCQWYLTMTSFPATHPCGDNSNCFPEYLSLISWCNECWLFGGCSSFLLKRRGGGVSLFCFCLFCFFFFFYWPIQRSWFARVNAHCNLSRKKSREVAAHFRADFLVGVTSRCV